MVLTSYDYLFYHHRVFEETLVLQMYRLIDRSLTALFKVADYVTSKRSLTSSESSGDCKPKIIRFAPTDVESDL